MRRPPRRRLGSNHRRHGAHAPIVPAAHLGAWEPPLRPKPWWAGALLRASRPNGQSLSPTAAPTKPRHKKERPDAAPLRGAREEAPSVAESRLSPNGTDTCGPRPRWPSHQVMSDRCSRLPSSTRAGGIKHNDALALLAGEPAESVGSASMDFPTGSTFGPLEPKGTGCSSSVRPSSVARPEVAGSAHAHRTPLRRAPAHYPVL